MLIQLSATKMRSFSDCQYKYYLTYIIHAKQNMAPHLRFGILIHKMMEDFHRWANDNKNRFEPAMARIKMKEICARRKQHYIEVYPDHIERLGLKDIDLFDLYLNDYTEYFIENELIKREFYPEFSISVRHGKYLLRGKIDIFMEPNVVIDFKTGEIPKEDNMKKNIQLSFYSLIRSDNIHFSYIYLKKPMVIKSFSINRPNPHIMDDIVRAAAPMLQAKSFTKNYSACTYCSFRFICRPDVYKKKVDSDENDFSGIDTI